MSYVGFVLDLAAGADGIDLGRKLHRIADQGGVEGGAFVALQAALGTKVPAAAAEAARTTLVDVALGSGRIPGEQRVLAAETLSRLGDERGLAALTALAEDPDLLDTVDPLHRDAAGPTFMSPSLELWDGDGGGVSFARRRSRLDTARKLTAVMCDPTLDPAVRREADRVRRAFGRLIKDPDLTAEGPAGPEPGPARLALGAAGVPLRPVRRPRPGQGSALLRREVLPAGPGLEPVGVDLGAHPRRSRRACPHAV
jgi:hypothetical protein